MPDRGQFQTTSIHLASAILVQVPDAAIFSISPRPSVDGKRLIVLDYPFSQSAVVQTLIEHFHNRRLSVPLYAYNRALNMLRDRLMGDERAEINHATAGRAVAR